MDDERIIGIQDIGRGFKPSLEVAKKRKSASVCKLG